MILSLICKIFGHKYYVHKFFTPTIKEIRCKRCGGQWGMNSNYNSIIKMEGNIDGLKEMLKRRG